MMRSKHRVVSFVLVLVCCGLMAAPSWAQSPGKLAKVEQAAPSKPTAAPKEPRKLLVFNLCRGFEHSSIPLGAKTLEIIGKKTGAYEAVLSDDIAMFEPRNLSQFDAVCMNNATGALFLPKDMAGLSADEQNAAKERDAALKNSLADFVKNGGGLIGIHAATDCFYEWAEYGEMMGGYFDGHPWNEEVGIKIDDPAHPVVAAFKGRGFKVADEIYQIKEPYSREKLRVLLSLDTANTDMSKDGIKRQDGDFGISWLREYGKGRIFYCSFGHRDEIFWTPAILQHYLDGIQYAMGDLAADATPSAQLSKEYLDTSRAEMQKSAFAQAVADLAQYELGQNRDALTFIEECVNGSFADSAWRAEMAEQLAALLSGESTADAKDFTFRMLYRLGVEKTVPAIAQFLTDEKFSHMARYALERMDSAEVDKAYIAALANTGGAVKVGIIDGLGERGSREAVDALAPQAKSEDISVARAAVVALGRIGGAKAADVLAKMKGSCPDTLREAWADAYLICADVLLGEGNAAKARKIYEEMYAPSEAIRVRVAAFTGLATALGTDAAPAVMDALKSNEPKLQAQAAVMARKVPGATSVFAEGLEGLSPEAQELLLVALAEREDSVALPAVMKACESASGNALCAALSALAALGDASCVPVLAKAAASGEEEAREAARKSLARVKGEDIDSTIVAYIGQAAPAEKVEAIHGLAARRAVAQVPALLEVAKDGNVEVRVAAFEALGELAGEGDLPSLVSLLVNADSGALASAEAAILNVCTGIEDVNRRAAVLLGALTPGQSSETKCALLRLLGQTGDNAALNALRDGLKSDDKDVRDTAIRALAGWANAEPLEDVLTIAQGADDETSRIVALRGFVNMVQMLQGRTPEEVLALYRKAAELAKSKQEKELVLSGLGNMGHPIAMELIRPYLKDKEVKDSAQVAAGKVKTIAYGVSASANGDAAKNAVDGDKDTRWDSGASQKGGEWFQVDMMWPQKVTKVTLDSAGSPGDYARGYEVYVSDNPEDMGKPVARGVGKNPIVEIECKKAKGRYVRVVQTGKAPGLFWSIHELIIESE